MWLSRLIVTAGLLLLSACSGFEIKSLGQALYEQNAVIAVVETGGRNGQLYSRQLRSRLQHGGARPHRCQHEAECIFQLVPVGAGICFDLKKKHDRIDRSGRSGNREVVLSDSLSANATLGTVSAQFAQTRSRPPCRRTARHAAGRPRRRQASSLFLPDRFLMKVAPRQAKHFLHPFLRRPRPAPSWQ